LAQNITLDGTLGPAATLTGPTYQIRQDLGQTVGSNLFHSFGKFNLNANETAVFQSAPAIRNILSRVTGGSVSSIDGLIFTQSGAVNLYLINPAGIVFGPNARLDIGSSTRGSFVATTLDAITFPNDSQFSATNPGTASTLLTIVGDPSGFLASQRTLPPIAATGSILGVYSGQSLLLLGGNITLDNSNVFVNFPQGGRVELGALAGAGVVGLSVNGNDLQLSLPEQTARADVTINRSAIDVQAEDAGSLGIGARNLDINNSLLLAGIGSGLGTINSQAGDITVNAKGKIAISNSRIFNNVNPESVGNGGNIAINAESLVLDRSIINASTQSRGNAGKISIQVNSSALFTGSSTIFNTISLPGGQGFAGGITLTAGSLSLLQGAELVANTGAQGSTSDITVDVRGAVLFDGQDRNGEPSGIFNVVRPGAVGNAGNIRIVAGSLALTRGARLQANSRGKGDSGDVIVQVRDLFLLDGADANGSLTGIFTDLDTDGEGNGGDINVTTGSLIIKNGAQFTANTFAKGNAGNITIAVRDQAVLDGFSSGLISGSGNIVPAFSGIFSAVGEELGDGRTVPAIGNGGEIRLSARTLSLRNGAAIGTAVSSGSEGDAGKVTITATEQITISDVNEIGAASGIFTQVDPDAIGNANDIEINTGLLTVANEAQLRASTAGRGKAGNIIVNSPAFNLSSGGQLLTTTSSNSKAGDIVVRSSDSIVLTGQGSGLFANTTPGSIGDGGSIFINPRIANPGSVTVRDGARIAVDSQGKGKGGNIDLNAQLLTLDNAVISAETASTQGGNIALRTRDILLLRNGSKISTTAGTAGAGGDGGNINIKTPFIVGVLNENSDITANAFTGRGGNITITTNAIYGLQVQPQLTPSSDITASSQFGISGTVAINTLNIDPSRGLVELPANLTDPSQQIAQGCTPGSKVTASSFVATGRGGIPLSPDEPLESRAVVTKWVPLPEEGGAATDEKIDEPDSQVASALSRKSATPIVEAQSWIVRPDGVVELVATAPNGDRSSFGVDSVSCRTSQGK
jgi:filamentous hemagglutinin family protein